MLPKRRWLCARTMCCALAVSFVIWLSPVKAGRILVANDDWIFWSPYGFEAPLDGAQFAQNVARWFVGESSGSFLAYSDHPGLVADELRTAMESKGHNWTVDTSVPFDMATLQAYDAVFVGYSVADPAVLVAYVRAGGNVYVMGGGPSAVDMWNPFLQEFGLEFVPGVLNDFVGQIPINDLHPLFDGVDHLFIVNGNQLRDRDLSDPSQELLVWHDNGSTCGYLFGIYDQQDNEGPLTTDVLAEPIPVGAHAIVMAKIDDSTTGGSCIGSAEYTIDGSGWYSMQASDGTYDEVSEDVSAAISAFSTVGVHEICVRGRDVAGNYGEPERTLLAVYDPDGGFVTGGGWIWSPAGAYVPDPSLSDKANFGFVSKCRKGATVPTGQTEFVFQAGDLNFHSSSYEWLVVTGSDYARFKGTGTINGSGPYKFMLWAGDNDPDTFRIKIWWEDGETENLVYDNGMDQAIGGGSIVVHAK